MTPFVPIRARVRQGKSTHPDSDDALANTQSIFDLTGAMWDYMATVHRYRSTGVSIVDGDLHSNHSDSVGDGVEIVDAMEHHYWPLPRGRLGHPQPGKHGPASRPDVASPLCAAREREGRKRNSDNDAGTG